MDRMIKVDVVTGIVQSELEDDIQILIDEVEYGYWSEFDQMYLEFESPRYRNVREKLALVLELIQHSDQVDYTHPPRTRHEMNGGIKIATRRGTRLHEVEVLNLYFRFRSHLAGDGIALMHKSLSTKIERIILLPDDTEKRYKEEQFLYRKEARTLLLKGQMGPDEQNNLLENLSFLNVHERCAQSIQHEYGHVLNSREFDILNILPTDAKGIYRWFLDNEYMQHIDKRFPDFGGLLAMEKLLVLKEALVEDYRISLNMEAERGKFILPNKFCFSGDFQNPDYLYEGVDLMKRILYNQIVTPVRRPASSSDIDSITAFHKVVQRRKSSNWRAGSLTLTKDIIDRDLEELEYSSPAQAAATKTQ